MFDLPCFLLIKMFDHGLNTDLPVNLLCDTHRLNFMIPILSIQIDFARKSEKKEKNHRKKFITANDFFVRFFITVTVKNISDNQHNKWILLRVSDILAIVKMFAF